MYKLANRSAEKGVNFKLREGFSAETSGWNSDHYFSYSVIPTSVTYPNYLVLLLSGGLVVILPKDNAESFCKDIKVKSSITYSIQYLFIQL